ncbi:MAG: hypothetical protein EBV03_09365, partial [Proteobacteria bacterium]|nr:hypothetical protein [Pseudomonadota bacterium]
MLTSRSPFARVNAPHKADPFAFAGEMAPVLRAHNWQQSPLGQPELWPQSLCMALNMCLCAHFPMALIWGSELTLLYNEGWRHLAGGMHPWCLGRSAPNLWSASWGNVARRIQSMLEGGEDVPTPMLPLTPQTGGDTCYCSMSPVRGENGKIAGFFITPAELSGHQYAVGSLRKARKEEQARNAFLAHMSHEIRTPMSAVVGLSNLLAMDRKLSGKQKEMARTLQQNAQSVLLLVNDLLDLAHIEMNGLQMECVPFTFNDILSQIFIGLSLKAQEKKISLDYEPAALGAQTYMGDPLRIKQMVGTLVSAAVNAVPRGAITITLAEDKSEKSQQCAFKFSVCSPVVRTAQQQLEWMFESMPGQKLHNTYSDAELG